MPTFEDTLLNGRCPPPQSLRTGDLLFPRKPDGGAILVESFAGPRWRPGLEARLAALALAPEASMRKLLTKVVPPMAGVLTQDQPLVGYSFTVPGEAAPASDTENLLESGAGELDLTNPRTQMLLYKIMAVAFADLVDNWLDMSIRKFMLSPIGRFLLETLTAKDVHQSFFVGHVAMVLCEKDGDIVSGEGEGANVFVIEANVTDYAHYRVAIHPYYVADEPQPSAAASADADLLRGWANHRVALGEKVWCARPAALDEGSGLPVAQRLGLQQALGGHAKALLGRPYGFFDNPVFGDTDHFYCSEFLFTVFELAGRSLGLNGAVKIDELRQWGWLKKYLVVSGQTRLLGLVNGLMADQRFPDARPFFVLTPPMVWSSAAVGGHWSPMGEGPYSPVVP